MDLLIFFGGTVKAEGDGKYRAPLVTFGNPAATDVSGEYFTAKTDFWREFPSDAPSLYHHGMDGKIGLQRIGVNGKARITRDDAAVWMAGQLDMANEYEKRIYALIEAEKMGTSSGSAPHMVERKTSGKAIEILSWPIVEASLTPTPAEWRNKVVAVKSLEDIKSLFSYAEDSSGGEDADPFAAIGLDMTSRGMYALWERTCSLIYSALRNDNGDSVPVIIERFSALAKQFAANMLSMDSEDRADMMKCRPESIREFERLLRDAAGLSRAEAKAVAAHGFGALLRDAASDNSNVDDTEREALKRELACLELAGLAAAGV
jgi:hypothetical protein